MSVLDPDHPEHRPPRTRSPLSARKVQFEFSDPPILTPKAARALLDILMTHHGDDEADEAYSSAKVDQSGHTEDGELE